MEAPLETRRRARQLRAEMSRPEIVLWVAIRGRKLGGLHFRKQHPIGPYVLDFYCHEARLCVEVDGASHGMGDRPQRDARRDRWLARQGIRTLRMRAAYILPDPEPAARMILAAATGEV